MTSGEYILYTTNEAGYNNIIQPTESHWRHIRTQMKICPSLQPLVTCEAVLDNCTKNITERKNASFIKRSEKIHCPCRTLPQNTVTDHFPTVILQQLKNVSSTSLRSILTRQAVPSCKYHCLIWRVWSGAQTQAQEMAGFDSIRRQSFYLLQLSSPYNHLDFTQRTCIHTRTIELKWDQVSPSLLL